MNLVIMQTLMPVSIVFNCKGSEHFLTHVFRVNYIIEK